MKKNDLAEKRDVFGNVTLGSAAKYALLPGIFPRLRGLATAFNHFLFTFVQIFGMVGLIDKAHPCLRPENIGRYRFGDIVSLAAEKVVFDRKHLPQTIMFFAVLGTIFLCAAMLLVGIFLVLTKIPEAHAQYFGKPTDAAYTAHNATGNVNDWAFTFLSEVFGKTGVSSLWGGLGNVNDRNVLLHPILKQMFATYSQALLVIAAFMVVYFVVSMLLESARTGTPFGQNFNSVWAPVRLALGIGLLVPLGSNGYNGAQLVAFQMADWGSNLATNIWISGLSTFTNATNPGQKLIAMSQPGEPYKFMRGVFLAYVCEAAVNKIMKDGESDTVYAQIGTVTDNNGHYVNYEGSIKKKIIGYGFTLNSDYCGQFKIPEAITPFKFSDVGGLPGGSISLGVLPKAVIDGYRNSSNSLITTVFPKAAEKIVQNKLGNDDKEIAEIASEEAASGIPANQKYLSNMHVTMLQSYRSALGYGQDSTGHWMYLQKEPYITAAKTDGEALVKLLTSGKFYGWASAGSFMMTLVYANNIMSTAVNTPPIVTAMPRPLTSMTTSFYVRNGTVVESGMMDWLFGNSELKAIAKVNKVLNAAKTWFEDVAFDASQASKFQNGPGNKVTGIDYAEWKSQLKDNNNSNDTAEGASPLEDGKRNFVLSMISIDQQDMNPMAAVIAIGNGMFITATFIVGAALLAAMFGAGGYMSMALSIAVPIIIGAYLLAVVLPLALFFNFTFAVIEWVVSVFEAVVGMPLWALSFISVGGDGIGQTAQSGFMKLVEIMLRPTIIIIATVGSFILFSASAHFFNKAYAMYTEAYFSVESWGSSSLMFIGSMFMYAMAMYSIGNSCFKIIPTIANQFMDWIGGPRGFSGTLQFDMNEISGLALMYTATNFAKGVGSAVDTGANAYKASKDMDKAFKAYTKDTDAFNKKTNNNFASGMNKDEFKSAMSRNERPVNPFFYSGTTGSMQQGNMGANAGRPVQPQQQAAQQPLAPNAPVNAPQPFGGFGNLRNNQGGTGQNNPNPPGGGGPNTPTGGGTP